MDAWQALLLAQRALLDRLEDDLRREHGLPLSSYEVLLFLSRAPGRRLRMHELAESVLLTPSGITRLVDRLEGEGLVSRESCPTDRRGSFVVLTEAGRARPPTSVASRSTSGGT
ncbi:MAG: MarR family transcriptional regulator [Actinobacteria bacterium]|nr:MAG: MarR family transcriptional regulator [Actinomycetota bacterium]